MFNLRYLGGRRIGGIVVAFTDVDRRDSYGNYWTADTDFALQRYERRPLYYQHNGAIVEAGYVEVADLIIRADGLYMEAELLENDAGNAVLALIQAGRGHYSTGVMPGSWREASDGWVEFWPLVEISVTDRPATRDGLTQANVVRSALGLPVGNEDEFMRRGPIMPENIEQTPTGDGAGNGQNAGATVQADPPEMVTMSRSDLNAALQETVRGFIPAQSLPPAGTLPVGVGAGPVLPQIQVAHQFDDVSLAGLAMWTHLRMSMGKAKPGFIDQSVRAMVDKVNRRRLIDDAITDEQLMRGAVRMVDGPAMQVWGPHLRANEAMQATYANYGDELVPTLLHGVIWYFFQLEAKVLNALQRFTMPSNPYDYPVTTSGPTIRLVSEISAQASFDVPNSPFPSSKIGTDKITYTANKIGAMILGSSELLEDSGVGVADVWMTEMIRAIAAKIDEVLISGDERATTANDSHLGTDPTGTAYDAIMALNGLRYFATDVDSTATAQTSISVDSPSALRATMGTRGVLGLYPDALVMIVDPAVYYDLLELDALESYDQVAGEATLLTGRVGHVKRVPVIVSDQLEATNASGQIEDSHDSSLASYLVVHRDSIKVGIRRELETEFFKQPGVDGFVMDAGVRLDMQKFETGAVAYGYNVGGS